MPSGVAKHDQRLNATHGFRKQICMRPSIVYMHSSVVDPFPQTGSGSIGFYDFGPPGSASGSVSHKYRYGSGSGSRSSSKNTVVRKPWFLLFCDFFVTFYQCSGPHADLYPYVFGPPGSAFIIQMYKSEDPHPDPYQNVTDQQHWCIELLSLTHIWNFSCLVL